MKSKCCKADIVNHWGERCSSCQKSSNEFIRTAAQQNIDPEYVKSVSGISQDLLGAYDPDCQKCKESKCKADLQLNGDEK